MSHGTCLMLARVFAVGLSGAFGVAGALADRPAVELALARMEQAVLAGDPEAYLALVSRDDPVFLKEQQNWAADLKRHAPSEFELRIHEPEANVDGAADGVAAAPRFDDDAGVARFELVMSWTMPGIGREGKDVEREVSFPVVFRRSESAGTAGGWLYCGEDWRSVHSGGDVETAAADPERPDEPVSGAPNLAKFFPGFEDVAERVVRVLPGVRAHVDGLFETALVHRQEVKIYPSMRHLQASIYLSYVDGLSGWNEPGESIKLLASKKSGDGSLRSLLAHEYGHVATFELGPRASEMPWWILEGVADLCAEKYTAENAGRADKPEEYGKEARAAVERWAKRGNLAPWDQISDFRRTPRQYGSHVYKQGQAMVGYISARFGRRGRIDWLRALAQGLPIEQASEQALGVRFDEIDRDWRDRLPKPEPDDEVEREAESEKK